MKTEEELSFYNEDFINSDAGRGVRILSEYLSPGYLLEQSNINNTIVVFGSARIPSIKEWEKKRAELQYQYENGNANVQEAIYPQIKRLDALRPFANDYEDCVTMTEKIAEWNKKLPEAKRFYVCTGGGPGIMEAANKGAAQQNTPTIGLNIKLPHEQHSNPFVTKGLNFHFRYFFMRKFWFSKLAQAFVVMPGGYGTMDELFEVLTLLQTKKIERQIPIVLYNEQFWRKIFNFDHLAEIGMIDNADLFMFKFCSTPDEAFTFLTTKLQEIHDL